MVFNECWEVVCVELAGYLNEDLNSKGLSVATTMRAYDAMMNDQKDAYSKSLLMKGVNMSERFPFSNTPYTNLRRLVENNLAKIFTEILQREATQRQVYKLARLIRGKSSHCILTPSQCVKLAELEDFKKEVEKVSEWCVKARAILMLMHDNVKLLASVTEEEKEFANSLQFDWFYSYSDQASTWRHGRERHEQVKRHATQVVAEKPHLKKVVEVISNWYDLGPRFFLN